MAEKVDKKSCLLSVDTPPLDTPSGIHRDHYKKEEQIVCDKQTQEFVLVNDMIIMCCACDFLLFVL